jgi:hypothetical protein
MVPRDPYTPWKLWAALAAVLIALPMACSQAHAAPVLETRLNDRVHITLHNDACTIEAVRGGEYLRAAWVEDGKLVEGCWAYIAAAGVVVFYFADFTIGAIPGRQFHKVVES